MDFELSITICSWNTKEDTRKCLQSIYDCYHEGKIETIVIENASEDSSAEMIENEFPWVKLIKLKQNVGFAKGHNIGFKESKGEILMALNSDTIVHGGALKKLISFFMQNKDVGIAGPKLLNPDGSLQYSCRKFPTPLAALFRNTPLGKMFPKNKFARDYLMQDWAHDESRDVDWLSGAALCIKRELYEKIGGFDEQFFMYLEDVDLCKRAHEAGYRVVYLPDAIITHAIGRSSDRVANEMIKQFHKSMMLYYKKHNLRKIFILFRPFAFVFAKLFLWLRQTTLLIKNKLDDWKRRRQQA